MGVTITFNYANWALLFPQFNYLNSTQITMFFNLATQFVRNDGGGPVSDTNTQTNLLNVVTAHLCKLLGPQPTGQGPNDTLVGRISNASEGSVSVAVENQYPPGSAQWWQQTQYGSVFWEMSKPFRTARYLRGHVRTMDPWPLGLAGFTVGQPGTAPGVPTGQPGGSTVNWWGW